jgi:hypothetical protein
MNTTGPIRIGVACNIHMVGAIVVVISTEAGRTLLRIPLVVVLGVNSFLELVLRLLTFGPNFRVLVGCNIHTTGAILVVRTVQVVRTLLRIPLVVVLGLNSCHLQQPCLYWFPRHICLLPM